ncbi:helix-turn-helix domain-containing protein [Streptomyces sp. NPDC057382]|uniref:AraC-like ligand-binding domain-containing protein n=1 Tax=unclassified Streptomyces TaxID=2593676 RepID=UPI00363C279C
MPVVLSTASLPPADRGERWHHAVSHTFVPLDVRLLQDEPSPGRIVGDRLGPLRVSQVQAGPQVVTRSRRLIARDGEDALILTLQQRGSSVKEQDGRETRIGPGEFSLSDAARPFRKKVPGAFRFTSFQFPREELRVRDEDLRALTATAFSGREGSAALVASYFARLAREAPHLGPSPGRRFAATALELLAVLIDERSGRYAPQAEQAAAATLVRVKDHILRHLSDPELSPPLIAAAHFMSVRYLHKLFRAEGVTVGEWIRTQRLERCRRDLLGPGTADRGVAAVARHWGFVSPSHFSRAFRAAYGMTPREWQRQGLPGTGSTTEGRPDTGGGAVRPSPGAPLQGGQARGGATP